MKVANWLRESTNLLQQADVPTARLDCLVLLEDITHKSRAHLLAYPELELTPEQLSELSQQLAKRIQHIPLAFIRGKTEFYGRDFIIDSNVLEPRPESETMIELLKSLPSPKTIVDVGTGSGALAITAKFEIPNADVHAVDIDASCLVVAGQNAKKHASTIELVEGHLFEPYLQSSFENLVVLANLPYVPDEYPINQAAMQEPRRAIFGGADGLDLYRELFAQLASVDATSIAILCESLPFQHKALQAVASSYDFKLQTEDDFIQLFVDR